LTPARAAGLLVAAAAAASAWHVLASAAPPAWDDAWYLETAFRLWEAFGRGLADGAAAWSSALRSKPPLLALLPLPLFALTGPSERLAPLACVAAQAAACLFTGLTARALWPAHPRRGALAALAAALTALLPLLYGVSRRFYAESLLAALAAAAAWRLASREGGAALGAALGLGVLAKASFPLFVAGPLWLRRAALGRRALLTGAALAATWWAFNLPYAAGYAWSAGFGGLAADYGRPDPFGFPARLAAQALSWPLALAGLAVFSAAAARGPRRPDEGTVFALAWAAPLAVFALSSNLEPRLWAPALPALALLAARAACAFDGAAALLLGAGGAVFVRQTFLLAPQAALPWNGAPVRDAGWDRGALLDAAEAAAGGASPVAALALEHRLLNANNLSSLAAQRGSRLRVVSLGYAQRSAEAALLRLKDKDASALILVDGADGPDWLNAANAGVAAALAAGRLRGRLAATVPLAPGVSARVYRIGRSME
jgi:hypothetical protein